METKNAVTLDHCWVGMRVWSTAKREWGVVTSMADTFITVRFDHHVGTYCITPQAGGLFYGPPEIIGPEPPPKPVKYKNVNGFKVPDIAIRYIPSDGCYAWIPSPGHLNYALSGHVSYGYDYAMTRLRQGLLYPNDDEGLQAAAIHAKAWLGEGVPWQESQ